MRATILTCWLVAAPLLLPAACAGGVSGEPAPRAAQRAPIEVGEEPKVRPSVAAPVATSSQGAAPLVQIEPSALSAPERVVFDKVVSAYLSPCGDAVTLDVCVAEHRACTRCGPAYRAATKLVHAGMSAPEIRTWLDARFSDAAVMRVDVAGSPAIGAASTAPVTLVEFVDFECPFCGLMAPFLRGVVDEPGLKGSVLLVYKAYPIDRHPHADLAARAAIAAAVQGKFWEMSELLFAHQDALDDASIEGLAKTCGVDLKRWKADLVSPATLDRVKKDRALGDALGITGTPALFVNGRPFVSSGADDARDEVREWLRVELALSSEASPPPKP